MRRFWESTSLTRTWNWRATRYARFAPRLQFEHQSIFELKAADGTFDLTVCRHVLHSIPHPERVLAEFARVTRRGGYLHLIPEDYGMLHFQRAALDPMNFWHVVAPSFAEKTGTDLFMGRDTFSILAAHGAARTSRSITWWWTLCAFHVKRSPRF